MKAKFKNAKIGDHEDINRYLCNLKDEHYKNLPDIFEPSNGLYYDLKKFRKLIQEDLFVMITVDDINIGVIQVKYCDNGVAYLYALYIEEPYRNQNIGKQAMLYIQDVLRKNGWDILRLTVWNFNRAINLYRRLGFVLFDDNCNENIELYIRLKD